MTPEILRQILPVCAELVKSAGSPDSEGISFDFSPRESVDNFLNNDETREIVHQFLIEVEGGCTLVMGNGPFEEWTHHRDGKVEIYYKDGDAEELKLYVPEKDRV